MCDLFAQVVQEEDGRNSGHDDSSCDEEGVPVLHPRDQGLDDGRHHELAQRAARVGHTVGQPALGSRQLVGHGAYGSFRNLSKGARPISTAKLQQPTPAFSKMPRVNTMPTAEWAAGTVTQAPTAHVKMPTTNTTVDPKRSAAAPANGCAKPKTNCPTANAKLTVATPRPMEVFDKV